MDHNDHSPSTERKLWARIRSMSATLVGRRRRPVDGRRRVSTDHAALSSSYLTRLHVGENRRSIENVAAKMFVYEPMDVTFDEASGSLIVAYDEFTVRMATGSVTAAQQIEAMALLGSVHFAAMVTESNEILVVARLEGWTHMLTASALVLEEH